MNPPKVAMIDPASPSLRISRVVLTLSASRNNVSIKSMPGNTANCKVLAYKKPLKSQQETEIY